MRILASKRKPPSLLINAKRSDSVTALVAREQEIPRRVDREAPRIIAAGPFFADEGEPVIDLVGNEGDGTIAAVDAQRFEITARMKAAPGLRSVRVEPRQHRFGFVVNSAKNIVYIFDTASNHLMHTVPIGRAPDQITFTSQFAYVRNAGSEFVDMIKLADITKEAAVTHFPAGEKAPAKSPAHSPADAIVPAPEGGSVLVADGLLMTAPWVFPDKLKNTFVLSGTGLPMLSVTVAAITVVSVALPLSPEPLVSSASVKKVGAPIPGVGVFAGVKLGTGVGVTVAAVDVGPPGVAVAPPPPPPGVGVVSTQPVKSKVQSLAQRRLPVPWLRLSHVCSRRSATSHCSLPRAIPLPQTKLTVTVTLTEPPAASSTPKVCVPAGGSAAMMYAID